MKAQRFLRDDASSAVFCIALLAVYSRLFFGADLTDESFYVALPYSFSLGHRPFVDELAVHQLAALLLRPAVDAWVGGVGSNAALVLFVRHLYFASSLACALLFRSYAKEFVGKGPATLLAAVALAYVPFHIPSISYNTIAYLGLFAGSTLFASACLPGRHPSRLSLGTALLAVATFAYPTLAVVSLPSVALALVAFCQCRERALRRSAFLWVGLGGSAVVAWAGWQVVQFDMLSQLGRMLEVSDAMGLQGGGSGKYQRLAFEVKFQSPYTAALLLLVAGVTSTFLWPRARRFAVVACLLFGPALALVDLVIVDHTEPYTSAPFVFSTIAPLALLAVPYWRQELPRGHWISLLLVVLPSLFAGAAITWASANGLRNATLGLMPAALIGLMALGIFARGRGEPVADGPGAGSLARPYLAFSILLGSLLCFQLFQLWTELYRDAPIPELTESITRGAWRGLRTTPERRQLIETMGEDLERLRGDSEDILFLDYFPAGYLMSDLRPRTPALWLFPGRPIFQGTPALRRVYARGFEAPNSLPDLVVDMRCRMMRDFEVIPVYPDDPVRKRLAAGRYRDVASRECYRVDARRN